MISRPSADWKVMIGCRTGCREPSGGPCAAGARCARRRPPRAPAASRPGTAPSVPCLLRFPDLPGPEGGRQDHGHDQQEQAQPGWHALMMSDPDRSARAGRVTRCYRAGSWSRPVRRVGPASRRRSSAVSSAGVGVGTGISTVLSIRRVRPGPGPLADPGLHGGADLGHHLGEFVPTQPQADGSIAGAVLVPGRRHRRRCTGPCRPAARPGRP